MSVPSHDRPLTVRLNMDLAPAGMEQLTPGGSLRWGESRFELNPPPGGRADFCVVLANARPLDRFRCAPHNTLLITGEPPEKKVYPVKYYAQFQHVVDTHALSRHPRVILAAPGLVWHVGLEMSTGTYRFGYDHLVALECPDKQNRISVVCSDAAFTPGQKRRLALLRFLKERLGNRIVHFGRGFQSIEDKMDAILPYRYHLVLENSRSPHYWTEKLSDAYLGWAFPVYLGCPNIGEYVPGDSLAMLDGDDFEAAERMIRGLLEVPMTPDRLAAVGQARDLVLNRYNPFAWSAHWAQKLYRPGPDEDLTIRIHKAFRPFPRGGLYRLRQRLGAGRGGRSG